MIDQNIKTDFDYRIDILDSRKFWETIGFTISE